MHSIFLHCNKIDGVAGTFTKLPHMHFDQQNSHLLKVMLLFFLPVLVVLIYTVKNLVVCNDCFIRVFDCFSVTKIAFRAGRIPPC